MVWGLDSEAMKCSCDLSWQIYWKQQYHTTLIRSFQTQPVTVHPNMTTKWTTLCILRPLIFCVLMVHSFSLCSPSRLSVSSMWAVMPSSVSEKRSRSTSRQIRGRSARVEAIGPHDSETQTLTLSAGHTIWVNAVWFIYVCLKLCKRSKGLDTGNEEPVHTLKNMQSLLK